MAKKKTATATDDLDIKVDFGDLKLPKIDPSIFDVGAEEAPEPAMETRYINAKPPITGIPVLYDHAVEAAKAMKVGNGERYDAIIIGNFVFGDFIGAYLFKHHIKALKMTISTLSLNQRNVDMLASLMKKGYLDELNLIVSCYFYGHEKHQLIPYIYKTLDFGDRFQLAVAGIHTKIVHFHTHEDQCIVIHGSANLRACTSVEQFTIEENRPLYDFYEECFTKVLDRFGTIKKSVLANDLWHTIAKKKFND